MTTDAPYKSEQFMADLCRLAGYPDGGAAEKARYWAALFKGETPLDDAARALHREHWTSLKYEIEPYVRKYASDYEMMIDSLFMRESSFAADKELFEKRVRLVLDALGLP